MIDLSDFKGNELVLDQETGVDPFAIGFAKHSREGKVYGLDRFYISRDLLEKQMIEMKKINYFENRLKKCFEKC